MGIAIITGADKKFLPGVKAFYNSLKANGNIEADLILFAHGKAEDFDNVPSEFRVILNPDPVKSPASSEWSEEIPAMYSRVMIPRLLSEYDKAIWFDADIIVLQDLNPLVNTDMEDKPLAATFPGADWDKKEYQYMPFQLEKPAEHPHMEGVHSLQSGVLLYDIKKWHELELDKVVDNTLTSGIGFKYVVQGLMGYVVAGNFKRLHHKWNCPVSWLRRYNLKDIAVLHYVGGAGVNPWIHNMPEKDLWQSYHDRM